MGFSSQLFIKFFAVKDMRQNAVFTGIFVVPHLSHPSQKNLLLTTVTCFTLWTVWRQNWRTTSAFGKAFKKEFDIFAVAEVWPFGISGPTRKICPYPALSGPFCVQWSLPPSTSRVIPSPYWSSNMAASHINHNAVRKSSAFIDDNLQVRAIGISSASMARNVSPLLASLNLHVLVSRAGPELDRYGPRAMPESPRPLSKGLPSPALRPQKLPGCADSPDIATFPWQ